jgi:hypothetical protein
MPALMLFDGAHCEGSNTSMLMFNSDRGNYAGIFNYADIMAYRRAGRVKSIMMRAGYTV